MRVKQAMEIPILQRRCNTDLHAPNFHNNALQAMIVAMSEGKQHNSEYVKKLAYEFYEEDLKNDS